MKTVVKQAPSGAMIEFTPFNANLIEKFADSYNSAKGDMNTKQMFEAMRGLIVSINGQDVSVNTIEIGKETGKELLKKVPFFDLLWLAVQARELTYPNEPVKITANWKVDGKEVSKEHEFFIKEEGLGIIQSSRAKEVEKNGYGEFYKPYKVHLPFANTEVICYPPTIEQEDNFAKNLTKGKTALADYYSRDLKYKNEKGDLVAWDWVKNSLSFPDLKALKEAMKQNEGFIDTRAELLSPDGVNKQIVNFLASPDFFRTDTIL